MTESVKSLVECLRLFRFLSSRLLKDIVILLLVYRNFYWIELIMFFTYFPLFSRGFIELVQCPTRVRVWKLEINKLTQVRKTSNLKFNKLEYLLKDRINDNETLCNDGGDKDARMRKVKPCILMEMINE